MPVRTMVVWCCDWPVVAAGVPPDVAAAVFAANRVVATNPAARAEGITLGGRRRASQRLCPQLVTLERDPTREARAFEAVVAAVEEFTPRLELTVPGTCAFPTRGPSRYFGGDTALASRVATRVHEVLDGAAATQVGVADGPFAATMAARCTDAAATPVVVPTRESPAFLAPFPLEALDRPDLVDVWRRLGLRTLGDLAALPLADVVGRFGSEGERAHRLAAGLDERPPDTMRPPLDLHESADLDPPAERVEQVAVVGRALAERLHHRLTQLGLSCVSVAVCAETEHGERHERRWRHEGMVAAAMADRIRWQLDGWLNGPVRGRPTSGVTRVSLVPDQVVAATGRQLGFWGGETETAERAARALCRVERLLGTDAVCVPEWRGGRGPDERVGLVPAAAVDLSARAEATVDPWGAPVAPDEVPTRLPDPERSPPWPGAVPAPSPARVGEPMWADLVDATGDPVAVDGRLALSAAPDRLSVAAGRWSSVVAWAGPWPVDERWWDVGRRRRRARCQVVVHGGDGPDTAHLLSLEGGRWWLEGTYD